MSDSIILKTLVVQLTRLETKVDHLADELGEFIEEERERHALDEFPLEIPWHEE